eukprot:Pompholyxophrys_sp_v1_NODE_25_length_3766_cov_6.615468.p2 type:complete len:221 gc:universal NODE_25_length_3766_cov_6.615468:2048-1386(-)
MELRSLLSRYKLTHLQTIFDNEEITLDEFYLLSENDLVKLGIKMGPRKKLLKLMEKHSKDLGTNISSSVVPKARKLWTSEQLEQAHMFVDDKKISVRRASKMFNVPFETLRRRVNNNSLVLPPRSKLNPVDEKLLISWIYGMVERGFPVSRKKIDDKAKLLNIDLKCSQNWFYHGLKKRYPDFICLRHTEKLDRLRAGALNTNTIRHFSAVLEELIIKKF